MLVKLLAGAAVLALLGFLFVSSLETTRVAPYTVPRAHFGSWTLELSPSGAPGEVMLSLGTRPELVSNLFRQVFQRAMESMATPQGSSIPLVLRRDFDRSLARLMPPGELLDRARSAGLESAAHVPRCLAHRRATEGRLVRQVYFVVVDSPSIVRFWEQLARRVDGAFDASALTPAIIVASAEAGFNDWLPIRDAEEDCVAPITIED